MQLKVIENSTNPTPFHDGMHEEKACLHFDCGHCGNEFDENLLSSLDKGEDWFRTLTESDQKSIAKGFGYKYEIVGPNKIPYVRFQNGNMAYLVNLPCPKCNTLSLVAVDFYEKQPARYIASLIAAAEVEAK